MVRIERTGRDEHEIIEVGPEVCVNGHPLRHPNVLIGGDSHIRTYRCMTCDALITIPHEPR